MQSSENTAANNTNELSYGLEFSLLTQMEFYGFPQ
jgi:hypothetical protein